MNTTELTARPKYAEKFSRLWERYDAACHGNAQQMRDILEITLDALETAERHIFKTDRDYLELVEALERAQPKADVYDMLRKDYNLTGSLAEFVDWQAKRIAELEARTVTVTIPAAYDITGETDGNCQLNDASMQADVNGCYFLRRDVEKACTAAGIKCEVKGD